MIEDKQHTFRPSRYDVDGLLALVEDVEDEVRDSDAGSENTGGFQESL